MQKREIVRLFVGKKQKRCGFGSHFLFVKFEGEGHYNIERFMTDSHSAHPNYLKTSI